MQTIELRSSEASFSSGTLSSRRQYSKAKLGALEIVPRYLLIVSSQSTGRFRKCAPEKPYIDPPVIMMNR